MSRYDEIKEIVARMWSRPIIHKALFGFSGNGFNFAARRFVDSQTKEPAEAGSNVTGWQNGYALGFEP